MQYSSGPWMLASRGASATIALPATGTTCIGVDLKAILTHAAPAYFIWRITNEICRLWCENDVNV